MPDETPERRSVFKGHAPTWVGGVEEYGEAEIKERVLTMFQKHTDESGRETFVALNHAGDDAHGPASSFVVGMGSLEGHIIPDCTHPDACVSLAHVGMSPVEENGTLASAGRSVVKTLSWDDLNRRECDVRGVLIKNQENFERYRLMLLDVEYFRFFITEDWRITGVKFIPFATKRPDDFERFDYGDPCCNDLDRSLECMSQILEIPCCNLWTMYYCPSVNKFETDEHTRSCFREFYKDMHFNQILMSNWSDEFRDVMKRYFDAPPLFEIIMMYLPCREREYLCGSIEFARCLKVSKRHFNWVDRGLKVSVLEVGLFGFRPHIQLAVPHRVFRESFLKRLMNGVVFQRHVDMRYVFWWMEKVELKMKRVWGRLNAGSTQSVFMTDKTLFGFRGSGSAMLQYRLDHVNRHTRYCNDWEFLLSFETVDGCRAIVKKNAARWAHMRPHGMSIQRAAFLHEIVAQCIFPVISFRVCHYNARKNFFSKNFLEGLAAASLKFNLLIPSYFGNYENCRDCPFSPDVYTDQAHAIAMIRRTHIGGVTIPSHGLNNEVRSRLAHDLANRLCLSKLHLCAHNFSWSMVGDHVLPPVIERRPTHIHFINGNGYVDESGDDVEIHLAQQPDTTIDLVSDTGDETEDEL